MTRWSVRAGLALTVGAVAMVAVAPRQTQTYPSKPIRLLVPDAPGWVADITAHLVAQKMGETLGQTQHLAAEHFKLMAAIDMQTVPFKASAAVVTALRDNDIHISFEILAPSSRSYAAVGSRPSRSRTIAAPMGCRMCRRWPKRARWAIRRHRGTGSRWR